MSDDSTYEGIADAVHEAEEKAFHLDDAAYVEEEKKTFDKLADGVVGYEKDEPEH